MPAGLLHGTATGSADSWAAALITLWHFQRGPVKKGGKGACLESDNSKLRVGWFVFVKREDAALRNQLSASQSMWKPQQAGGIHDLIGKWCCLVDVKERKEKKNQFILGSRFECYRMESQICVSFSRQACHGATARAGSSSPPVNPGVSFLWGGTFESLVQEEKEGREWFNLWGWFRKFLLGLGGTICEPSCLNE